MNAYLGLIVGLICAGFGGELFVRGTVGIAQAARISPGIIAATVAAFATSSPELTVGISSALEGVPQVSLGDVLGSNVVNVALILGLALLIAPINVPRDSISRDFPVAILVPLAVGIMLIDGQLSRLDGAILLIGFLAWLYAVVQEARRQRAASEGSAATKTSPLRAIIESGIGLGLLIAAGKLIVFGATGIAQDFGLSAFVIGATVVALGTSVPELATTVISSLRGHDEVGLGTILGSNIFNGTFILGVVSLITPVNAQFQSSAWVLGFGIVALALIFSAQSGRIGRSHGTLLLALYLVYVGVTLHGG
jgi:cation:H+ antiporter